MDLGISGRTAIVCASSKGLGRACAEALAEAGVNLVMNARSPEALETAADEIRSAYNVTVETVAADVTSVEGCEALQARCSAPDILVNNAGGPPAGDWRKFEREDWHKAVDSNMIGAIFLMKAYLDGMAERGFGRVVNITSGMVKAPRDVLSLSVAARLGLTGFVRGIVPTYAAKGVTINNLLPELFDTDRLRNNIGVLAKRDSLSLQEAIDVQLADCPAGRMGRPDEFGGTCAFLCSVQAGYMTGQSILLDGGRYPGVF